MEHRRTFSDELSAVSDRLAHMSALVIEGIGQVTDLLLDYEVDRCREIIDADDLVDAETLDVEERIYRVIALQHPVATDLRLLVAAMKIASEVERSADLVVNIAKAAARVAAVELPPGLRGLIVEMSEQAAHLFGEAIVSLRRRDAVLAESLHRADDVLDDLHRHFIEAVLTSADAGDLAVHDAIQLALIGRFYERLGDHAVNVGERIHFVITGSMPAVPVGAEERGRP